MYKLLTIFFLIASPLLSQASGFSLAEIISINSDRAFPNTTVEVKYSRHCSTAFVKSIVQKDDDMVGIAILLESDRGRPCQMHESVFIEETVYVEVYSMSLLTFFKIENMEDL